MKTLVKKFYDNPIKSLVPQANTWLQRVRIISNLKLKLLTCERAAPQSLYSSNQKVRENGTIGLDRFLASG